MSAPTAIPENAQSLSGPDGERLQERLRKLLPSPITDRNKEGLEKIASGVRLNIDAERTKQEADDKIVAGLEILDPYLILMHKVCEEHLIIVEELGQADGQPVRRIVNPPKKKTDAPILEESAEDLRRREATVNAESEQSVQPAADASPPHHGRKVKWDDDRLEEDSYIQRAVEEAMEYLPVCSGEPHPKARILISKLMDRLGLAGPDSPIP